MPGGIEINSNTTRIREAFQQYAMYNKRNRETLFRDQARKLAVELYNQTAAIAPSEDDIAAKVRSLGWRIPKNFADGRIARGTKEQWVGVDWERRKPKRRRGRPTKRSAAAYQAKMDWFFQDYYERPTLDQMQQFVIMMRTQARLYLASGWLGAVVDLGGSVKASNGGVSRDRGGAFITRNEGLLAVTLWNRSVGIVDVDEQKGFSKKAIEVRVADMWKYVLRKEEEGLRRLARAA